MPDETTTTESIATEQAPPDVDSTPKAEEAGAPEQPPAEVPPAAEGGEPAGEPVPAPSSKRWYVVKVQSGREESIREAIERRVKIEGLEEFFGQIMVPTEKIVEMVNGKRRTRQRKLFPGYLMCEVEYNDRILYLFRETSGVGDFVGGGINKAPPPMTEREIERLIRKPKEGDGKPVLQKPTWERGERVKVKEGPFAGMEGEIKEILEAKDKVRVELTIFGRAVPVELEYWAVEKV